MSEKSNGTRNNTVSDNRIAPNKIIYTAIVLAAIAIGVGLRMPLFEVGFFSDDYMQYAMLQGVSPIQRSKLDLCRFCDGSPSEVDALMRFGTLPWWSHPQFRYGMMRPFSSALIAFDNTVFGRDLVYHHLHSVFWWALLVVAVAFIFRKFFPFGLPQSL